MTSASRIIAICQPAASNSCGQFPGRIWAELEASGKMIGFYDLIVGATALERGSKVATFNTRHFAQIKGLSVIEPK